MTEYIPVTEEETTYCAVHPDRETSLRCNKCGRLMCVECAVQTPVGYRCRECVRGLEDRFYSAAQTDYALVFGVCAVLAGIAAGIASALSLPMLFAFFIAIPVGGGIAEAALRVIQRRRGRQSANIAAAGVAIGGIIGGIIRVYMLFSDIYAQVAARYPGEVPARGLTPPLDLVLRVVVKDYGLLVFIGVCAVVVYSRFKIRI
jgi:hypothetical protein